MSKIDERRAANRAHQAELRRRVFEAIRDAGPDGITAVDVGNATGIHPAAVETARRSLMRSHDVEATGPGNRARRYRVKP